MSARPIEIAARLGEYERDHAIVAMWHRGAKRREICHALGVSAVVVGTVLSAWLETEGTRAAGPSRMDAMDARNAAVLSEYRSGMPVDEICRLHDIERKLAIDILASEGVAA